MPTRLRTVSYHQMEAATFRGERVPPDFVFQDDFRSLLDYIVSLPIADRKADIKKQSKIHYLLEYKYIEKHDIINIVFDSAKYDHARPVINTVTMADRGILKQREDGDVEKNHISIKFDDEETAICIIEDNFYGIGIGKIQNYFDDMLINYCRSIHKDRFYRFDFSMIPSREFLEELEDMTKISLARFMVDSTELNGSDFADLADRSDIRREVELLVKPVRGHSMTRRMIRDYYEKKNRNNRIRRITVKGDSDERRVVLDTERIRKRDSVSIEVDPNGIPITQSVFREFNNLLLE